MKFHQRNNAFVLIICLLAAGLLSATAQEEVLFKETFNYADSDLPSQWWSEGVPAKILNGSLFVDADTIEPRVSTVWLDKTFSGDMEIEFDVYVVSSKEIANNLNFFLLYSDPAGKNLRDSRNERMDGAYSHYHQLNGYLFTNLANGDEEKSRFRFRYNPGFKLLEEKFAYECRRETLYHIRIIKKGNHFEYWTNDQLVISKYVDGDTVHNQGIIGFRTYRTALWWDNLTITRPE